MVLEAVVGTALAVSTKLAAATAVKNNIWRTTNMPSIHTAACQLKTANSPPRAYRSSISAQILSVLKTTAEQYAKHGDPDSDLRDAPEYIMNVNLAQGLTEAFPTLRYRLEHHAAAFENSSRNEINVGEAIGKRSARFDIVLLNRANNVPRYIIEVKRGPKILHDARRILSVAALDSGRRRWSHGFLVTILRRTEESASTQVAKLEKAIREMRIEIEPAARRATGARVKALYGAIGKSRLPESGKQVFAAVFQLSLVTGTSGSADLAVEIAEEVISP